MTTDADIRIQKAREHIGDALQELTEVVINRIWGYDDFTESYRVRLKETFQTLMNLRDTL